MGDVLAIPSGFQGKRLYNLFRPEFMERYEKPLSPDSFTGFGVYDYQQHHGEVREATRFLKEKVIRPFVKRLDKGEIMPLHGRDLIDAMHREVILILSLCYHCHHYLFVFVNFGWLIY